MNLLQPVTLDCPYCGERFDLLIDTSQPQQDTFEDCSVCCRPIHLRVSCAPGELHEVSARREDEA